MFRRKFLKILGFSFGASATGMFALVDDKPSAG